MSFPKSLILDLALQQYLDQSDQCDVKIYCNADVLNTHSIVLSAASDFFKDLLLHHTGDDLEEKCITLHGVCVKLLRSCLHLLYFGQVHFHKAETRDEFIKLLDFFKITTDDVKLKSNVHENIFEDPLKMSATNDVPQSKHRHTHATRKRKVKEDNGERPSKVPTHEHVCDLCGKTVYNKDTLKYHKLSHDKVNSPYQCGVCSAVLASPASLTNHLKSHTGKKKHSCDICGKRFVFTTELHNHRRSHTGERPFQCFECGKCLKTQSALRDHSLVHTKDKSRPCQTCGQHFGRQSNLNRHMKKVHGISKSDGDSATKGDGGMKLDSQRCQVVAT